MNYDEEIKNEFINNEINKQIKDYSKNRILGNYLLQWNLFVVLGE